MSRYLIAANLKRQALAAALARTVKEQSQLAAGFVQQRVNTLSGSRHGGNGSREVDDEDVDALIAASLQELGADALPADNANLDELDDLAIDGGEGEEGIGDDPNAEIMRRRRTMQLRAADKLAAKKAAQGQSAAGVTAPMQTLNDLALKRARAMIVKRFATSLDLDESSSVAQTLQRQATAAASQLNGAVQTKLDALKVRLHTYIHIFTYTHMHTYTCMGGTHTYNTHTHSRYHYVNANVCICMDGTLNHAGKLPNLPE